MNLILEEEETTERGQALSGIVEKLEIGKEQRPKVPVSNKFTDKYISQQTTGSGSQGGSAFLSNCN